MKEAQLENDLGIDFPTEWWQILDRELTSKFGDVKIDFRITDNSFLAKIGSRWPFTAWAVTTGDTVHITSRFGWGEDWRNEEDVFKRARIFGVIAHEAYHVNDQYHTGLWVWMKRYFKIRHKYTAKTHPMEKPAYSFGYKVRDKVYLKEI